MFLRWRVALNLTTIIGNMNINLTSDPVTVNF